MEHHTFTGRTPATEPPRTLEQDLHQTYLARELFWHNTVREMLTGLSVLQETRRELFDGRTAIITRDGGRIPIAAVHPVFACGLIGSDWERGASVAVECTIFRITTPAGEMVTLPVHEIRGLHSLSPDLVKRLEEEAMARAEESGGSRGPFGFAAFTSLGRSALAPRHREGAD